MFCVFVLCLSGLAEQVYATDLIKKSNSGICHPSESSWYERTDDYTPFNSLDECLASGGRLPKGMSANLHTGRDSAAIDAAYSRERFGSGWADTDGDCQDSRAEALIETSSTPVIFNNSSRCRVVRGRWISPFTGEVIQNASSIDIDHVVPLRWAWEHGANEWSEQKREQFANDPRNLWPVELSLNRSKGARGPMEWLPPAGQCQYISRFLRLVKIYGLHSTSPRLKDPSREIRTLLKEHC
ncbi:MAG: HNH endonuclease [Marinobacter sp.]|nr:HNH endonuclease [Marinobacter sp.]MBO6873630.1 HNH endonuclease [Marinobacter sp.]